MFTYATIFVQIVDKEAVEQVRTRREIPDIRPGYIVQLKVVKYYFKLAWIVPFIGFSFT